MKYAVADFGDRLWMICTHLDNTGVFHDWFFVNEGELYRGRGWSFLHTHTMVPKADLNLGFSSVMKRQSERWKRINKESPWKFYGGS